MASKQGSNGYSLGLSPYRRQQHQQREETESSKTRNDLLQKVEENKTKSEVHDDNLLVRSFASINQTQFLNHTFNESNTQTGSLAAFMSLSENRTNLSKIPADESTSSNETLDVNGTLGVNKTMGVDEMAVGTTNTTVEDVAVAVNQTNKVAARSSSRTAAATNKTTSKELNHSSPFPWAHMDPSSYFQFQLYQPKLPKPKPSNEKASPPSPASGVGSSSPASSSFVNELQSMLENRRPGDLLTVQDLQSVLYVDGDNMSPKSKSSPLDPTMRPRTSNIRPGMIEASLDEDKKTEKSKKLTAFPQPSVVSTEAIQKGVTVAGGLMGMLVGLSILPNLWLFGGLVGGFYGYDLGKRQQKQDERSSDNVLANIVMTTGTKLAKKYLQIYDACITLFFMYKTGQLSYQYYQQYARLDDRFAIQSKLDSWNARFEEGKIAFDRWEKENEVGRKVLAGLRTMWLVEERSLKKTRLLRRTRRTSKYRLIQALYDVMYWVGRVTGKVFQTLIGRGDGSLKEFVSGLVKWDLSQSSIRARLVAALVLVVVVNFMGVLFSSSPAMLSILALAIGMTYPSWLSQSADQLNDVWEDTRARGRGEDQDGHSDSSPSSRSIDKNTKPFLFSLPSWEWAAQSKEKFVSQRRRQQIDKTRFHYYYTKEGKKRYYRVGIPWFRSAKSTKDTSSARWPWQSEPPFSKPAR